MTFKELLKRKLNEEEDWSLEESIKKKIINFVENKFEKELGLSLTFKSEKIDNKAYWINETVDFKKDKYLSYFLKSLKMRYYIIPRKDKIYVGQIDTYFDMISGGSNGWEIPIREIHFDLKGNFEKEVK